MIERVLIANRAEVAIRIARACHDLGIKSVAVYSQDDCDSLHRYKADQAIALNGRGAAAYLDADALISSALSAGCDAIHPGYGFLSENATFASKCKNAGISFIGPSAETLALFGDKSQARSFAAQCDIPLAAGTTQDAGIEGARALMSSLGTGKSLIVKAIAGGGGRGMRVVHSAEELEGAWTSCASEAEANFGSAEVYAEEFIRRARHIEVQIVGDGSGRAVHLLERECSTQRRHQKLIEIAPSPWLEPEIRESILADAVLLASKAHYLGVGTVEFLVEVDESGVASGRYLFMEMNPRLQVEHTVTEEVTGVDLVQTQLRLAAGATLADLGLTDTAVIEPRGYAIQLRINMETLAADGTLTPSGGTIIDYEPPSGLGVRIEDFAYRGYRTLASFDSLLAKVITHSSTSDFNSAVRRSYRALCEFRITGVDTNIGLLQNLLSDEDFLAGRIDTAYLERHIKRFASVDSASHPAQHAVTDDSMEAANTKTDIDEAPVGQLAICASSRGNIVSLQVAQGDHIHCGQALAVIEAMKMEQTLVADMSGVVERVLLRVGDSVSDGTALFYVRPQEVEGVLQESEDETAKHAADAALALLTERKAALLDDVRSRALAGQRRRGALSARERIALLGDEGSFVEFGGLVRLEDVGDRAPAEGVITGTARIEGRPVVVMSQDFSVFGGSIGHLGNEKVDRAVELSLTHSIPLVMILEGGGHRIQDGQNSRDYAAAVGTFQQLARLSGYAPIVSVLVGTGFAANTALSGFADFIVMLKEQATMGLAGPALVKAGTGQAISAQDLGGAAIQVDANGLADLGVDTEEEAMQAARKYLSYLPSNATVKAPELEPGAASDDPDRAQSLLYAVPVNTRKPYDILPVIGAIVDCDSLFEIKPTYASNLVTGFARLNGKAVGIIANQAQVEGGMLDSPACEKGAHFIALCDAFGLPLIFLADIPGFSIGPESERSGLGRRSAKMLYELGHATVPRVSVILRKGYGLAYLAMAGGRSFAADACFAWPGAEICAMSVEGSVDVAYSRDYESASDPSARRQELIDEMRSKVGPIQAAEGFGIDDLIDPRETRCRLIEVLSRAVERRQSIMPAKHRPISPI